jgi:hypothetical protein
MLVSLLLFITKGKSGFTLFDRCIALAMRLFLFGECFTSFLSDSHIELTDRLTDRFGCEFLASVKGKK